MADTDYADPADPRAGVSPEQQALLLALDHLTHAEQAGVLDLLSERATGDHYWPRAEENFAEELATLYGLARGSDGLWRDAMVQDKDGDWVFDPSSVRARSS